MIEFIIKEQFINNNWKIEDHMLLTKAVFSYIININEKLILMDYENICSQINCSIKVNYIYLLNLKLVKHAFI